MRELGRGFRWRECGWQFADRRGLSLRDRHSKRQSLEDTSKRINTSHHLGVIVLDFGGLRKVGKFSLGAVLL
jgi:hypothetical protein